MLVAPSLLFYDRAGDPRNLPGKMHSNSIYGTTRETSPLSEAVTGDHARRLEGGRPLLFLNATSNETGRRIIVTPVKMTEPTSNGNALLADAYDLHELLCSPYRDPKTKAFPELSTWDRIARFLPYQFSPVARTRCDNKKPISIDVRLSTAAGASSSPILTHMEISGTGGHRSWTALSWWLFRQLWGCDRA